MAGQEDHDLLDAAVLFPGITDPVDCGRTDSADAEKSLWFPVEDIESLKTELFNNLRGPGWTEATDFARPQKSPDAVEGRRGEIDVRINLELFAVLGMFDPTTRDAQLVTLTDPRARAR